MKSTMMYATTTASSRLLLLPRSQRVIPGNAIDGSHALFPLLPFSFRLHPSHRAAMSDVTLAPAFGELSTEDRFCVFWTTAVMRDICLQKAQQRQQPRYHSATSGFSSSSLLVALLADTELPVQMAPAKRRKICKDIVQLVSSCHANQCYRII